MSSRGNSEGHAAVSEGSASETATAGSRWAKVVADLFTSPEDAVSDDPLLDVVRQDPVVAARYLRIVMTTSSFDAVIICITCLFYLMLFWQCSGLCDRPLRWWLLGQAMLHTLHLPVRLVFLAKVQRAEAEGRSMEACVTSFTASQAWKVSKVVSMVNYGCVVLGISWVVNAGDCSSCPGVYRLSVFVIAQALVRIVLALLLFRAFFPQGVQGAEDAPKVQGASSQQIEALQTLSYAPGLFEESAPSCAVCLCEYSEGEALRRLPCGHHFHCQCCDEWLHRSKQCPLCRQDIDTKLKLA